jgi:hypothetical protein
MSSREASSDRYRATSCTLGKQHPSRRRGAYDRHWCFGSPLPLAGAAWRWAGEGGGGEGSAIGLAHHAHLGRVADRVDRGSPVVSKFAVASDENLNPPRSRVWYSSPVIWRTFASRSACVTAALGLLGLT